MDLKLLLTVAMLVATIEVISARPEGHPALQQQGSSIYIIMLQRPVNSENSKEEQQDSSVATNERKVVRRPVIVIRHRPAEFGPLNDQLDSNVKESGTDIDDSNASRVKESGTNIDESNIIRKESLKRINDMNADSEENKIDMNDDNNAILKNINRGIDHRNASLNESGTDIVNSNVSTENSGAVVKIFGKEHGPSTGMNTDDTKDIGSSIENSDQPESSRHIDAPSLLRLSRNRVISKWDMPLENNPQSELASLHHPQSAYLHFAQLSRYIQI